VPICPDFWVRPPSPPRTGAEGAPLGECREVQSTVIADRQQRARGLACPQLGGRRAIGSVPIVDLLKRKEIPSQFKTTGNILRNANA